MQKYTKETLFPRRFFCDFFFSLFSLSILVFFLFFYNISQAQDRPSEMDKAIEEVEQKLAKQEREDSAENNTSFSASSVPDEQKIRVLLVASQEAMISSRFFGTIQQLYVKESDSFKKGAPLVQFNCNELAAERRAASAELRSSQETSRANNQLLKEQVVGQLETKLARLKVDEASARVNVVRAKMSNCKIVAPFAGQVVELKAKKHESLEPGSPIMLIQDSKHLEMHVHIPSSWLIWVKPGTVFQSFIEETGKSYPAEVTAIGARIDPVSRTIKIYAKVTGEFAELLPGMSGYATFNKP